MILTIALPESLREAGNQFARCIGMGPGDDRTFSHEPNAEDAEGNLYIITNGWVVPHFPEIAFGELVEPEWGCDIELAALVPPLIRMDTAAIADVIAVTFGKDIPSALDLFGLSPLKDPEEGL